MSVIDPQQKVIDLSRKRELVILDETIIANQPNLLAAFNLMPHAHGLTDQTICAELQMDKAQWSKCCSGTAHFPMNKFPKLFDICGSEAFLQRLNWERGYDAVPRRRKSQVEKELEQEKERNRELEMKLAHYQEFAGIKSNG